MSTLPVLDSELVYTARRELVRIRTAQPLVPERAPHAGEQYRFHFDMTKCIGCKCCVVACNEQNGNPAAINWRRVGEVEGGHYPNTRRHYLSMGCNHCLEPSCLKGCPVEAYTKNPLNGVVVHNADACIGCQYCTWNCSYGVPQYNAERGVVGKCDLCHNRLADNMAPACVAACPEGAISVEIVDVAEWRANHATADAPGLPSADDSISTTRVTLGDILPPDTDRVDLERVQPEHPHWPLVFMLVLTQLAVGAFAVIWLLDLLGAGTDLTLAALTGVGIAAVSLAAAPMHLGRPIYAWRALRGLKTSWLSREILGLSLFAGAASAYSAALFFDIAGRSVAGLATTAFGIAGVACSAYIYVVRARPAWFSRYTVAEFFCSALLLGPLFVRALNVSDSPALVWGAVAGGMAQLAVQLLKLVWLSNSETFELRASARLLTGRLRNALMARIAILVVGSILVPSISPAVAFAIALLGEWLGRWLFFVSVVPKNSPAAFVRGVA